LAIEADLTKPYIYVALHYQPEKTTSPEGDIFVEQWLMVQMLARLAPKGWIIYVKEHNSQFAERLYGEQGRTHDFYERLAGLDRVRLILNQTSSFNLIDHAKAVATVTGTVGLESAIRSVPVLSFGRAWYAPCEGVFDVKDSDEVQEVLDKIERGYLVDIEGVNNFLYSIESVSMPCYLNPGNKIGVSFGEDENLKNLTALLIAYADRE
jgi:capsule polysaccharide export protein KpsC/LpsZ